jgi:hypothetical protein
MYIPQSDQCSVPNSLTPVPRTAIDALQARLASVEGIVTRAQAAFDGIVNRTDLNTNGFPLLTHGGVPAGPVGSKAGQSVAGGKITSLKNWPVQQNGQPACIVNLPLPQPIRVNAPLATAAPPAPKTPPLTVEAHNEAVAPSSPFKPPTTGNVCLDIQRGYIRQEQVSPGQLLDCSRKGYYQIPNPVDPNTAKAMMDYWNAVGFDKLPKVPDQDVPDFNALVEQAKATGKYASDQEAMNAVVAGLGDYRGMGEFSVSWALVGLGAVGAYLLYDYMKKKRML